MKKLIFISVSCSILILVYAFSVYNYPVLSLLTTNKKQNTISCSPANAKYFKPNMATYFKKNTDSLEEIFINDNRKTAGEMRDGILYLQLETCEGSWYPETHEGNALNVYAFAEKGKPLQLPGPLIRVTEGTIINAEIHNTIPGSPLVLRGFYSRPGNPGDSVIIKYGETYKVQFKSGKAGTYFYWASDGTLKETFSSPALPYFNDSQLFGAFIIDPPNSKPDPFERIFMIGLWNDTLNGVYNGGEELAINGLTWPFTERLSYQQGVPVHWRVINASNQEHPMHLHGFYYKVNSRGNADTDTLLKEKERYLSITELLKPHQTISLTWTPEREGNWLFHCHTFFHIMAYSFLRKIPEMSEEQMNDISTHAITGMGGLIMGITVSPPTKAVIKEPETKIKERALTLIVQEKKNFFDTSTGFGFVLKEGNVSSDINASIPGPPIILECGKPVTIKIINRLKESTTIHWHGLEIESYFDGVAGWGNRGKELAPLVMPGDSFIVHMTPPRAGTFIYHTHMHNEELLKGVYGPFIVTEPGEKYNSNTNKIFLMSEWIDPKNYAIFLNGKTNTDTMLLKQGQKYRFRFINITAARTDLTVSVLQNGLPVKWLALAKDGADFPVHQQINKPARNQSVSIGQTLDFEFNPAIHGDYLFAIKDYQDSIVSKRVLRVN